MVNNLRVSRRQFIKTLTIAGAAISVAPLMRGTAYAASSWISVGKTDEFDTSSYKKVTLADGSNIYVTRKSDGTYKALSTKCTHKGCDVLWVQGRKSFQCPCHGGVYNSEGTNVAGPPKSALSEYTTKVENNTVYIQK